MCNPCPDPALPHGIGSFHKTLHHDSNSGLVNAGDFAAFETIACHGGNFEDVPQTPGAAKLVSPQAGWAHDPMGPEPGATTMYCPPRLCSDDTAAEMTELYWMALLRDKPFQDFHVGDPDIDAALRDLNDAFSRNLESLKLGYDLPASGGKLDLYIQTLFRCGLPGEQEGPPVSQFLLHDVAYGAQIILQKQFPYRAHQNYLTDWDSWLRAQNSGKDKDGNDYLDDNDFAKDRSYFEDDAFQPCGLRRIRNMRDLARFVNKDALHQAYFNAALLLANWKAPMKDGNPYVATLQKQRGFATLGVPHLLGAVSEPATRALRVVWRHKWGQFLRCRPEVYGGLMEAQAHRGQQFGLPEWVFDTEAARRIAKQGTCLLPMAFTAGSPAHPSYGAGHATVAGACVTILKAWFKEDTRLGELLPAAHHPVTFAPLTLVRPDAAGSDILPAYTGPDLTVGGELNKLAANIAFGRCMGGVHWRSDNTRSLRLGEQIATIILRRESKECAERPTWRYTNFDGHEVTIDAEGNVTVEHDQGLQDYYNEPRFHPW